MFEDSLIESGGRLKTKRGLTSSIAFLLEAVLVGVMVLIPLLFTDALPEGQLLMTFMRGAATAASPAATASRSGACGEADPDRYHQRPAAHSHQDSQESSRKS